MFILDMPFMWPEYNYRDVIASILNWEMFHQYYTSWPDWEKLMDFLDEAIEYKNKGKQPKSDIYFQATEAFNEVISQYLVEIKWNNFKWWDNKELENPEYIISPYRYFKIWHFWRVYLKALNFDESIKKWFEQLYVKRWNVFDFVLLDAILSYVYFKKELYIYFNPHFFELCIFDKEHFELPSSWMYLVANFWKLVNRVFCEHCIEKLRKKSRLSKIISNDKWEDITKALRDAFHDLEKIAYNDHYDDFELTLKWISKDPNRFHELDEKTKFGKVGFIKHKEKKVWVEVVNTKRLKDVKKSLKKK